MTREELYAEVNRKWTVNGVVDPINEIGVYVMEEEEAFRLVDELTGSTIDFVDEGNQVVTELYGSRPIWVRDHTPTGEEED